MQKKKKKKKSSEDPLVLIWIFARGKSIFSRLDLKVQITSIGFHGYREDRGVDPVDESVLTSGGGDAGGRVRAGGAA